MKKCIYKETFDGIEFVVERGKSLQITANLETHYLAIWDGIVNIMGKNGAGRTAVFVNDCKFIKSTEKKIDIQVMVGSASYIKELAMLKEVGTVEFNANQLYKLW